ncbi:hypothetical protein BHYA_0123g00100 [Botrytis hyacinthi]|uniref:Uncharacterized protein n=1 Tax=Botrytis hyacinthi TaxID=278943 RepID=A0A4Z1GLU8_9HELO|nr:hypothetical protein BHYA_0123g00100 [Botrytis hyacinthi]
MENYYQNPHYPVTGAGDNTIDGYYQNPYYPITDPQQYPSFPPENAEVSAGPSQDIDLQFQRHQLRSQNEQLQNQNGELQSQYNQLQMQHNDLQDKHNDLQDKHNDLQDKHNDLQDKQNDLQDKYDELQSRHSRLRLHIRGDPIAFERLFIAARKVYRANLVQHDNEHEAPAENFAPAGGHRYITRSTQKTQPVVMGEPVEDDDSNLTSDREYAPSLEGFSDEEMEDEDYEPTPKPVAPATVAHHEVRFTVKKGREQNMLIYHGKEFAYCKVSMTREEFHYVRGEASGAPQTLPTPDKNGNIQDHQRMRVTWAEREKLNAWRIRHGRKPHEIREGTKDAAARDSWRLNPTSRH